ncbi:MAG: hypothetical protein CR972_04150 [Candidatus Moraniibacteriota bacterium]|nr:MAG: hypothetical protein CR972_04150 [Candidatus Moranbacteria bacterium]
MNIRLQLKEKDVVLVLEDNGSAILEKKWIDNNDLLENFFPTLDEMLRAYSLSVEDIDDFLLDLDIPKGYTTARIARTIIKTLNFARQT